jgi:molybdopterin-guanine dinucleotide biosynthesis protein A
VTGVILAGGEGKRMGGASKAMLELDGRPLAVHVATVLAEVSDPVAIVCKQDTAVPEIVGVERWDEPAEPRHPLTGIVHALEQADGPVLVCAVDMPWVTAHACQSLMDSAPGGVAAVAVAAGQMCPVLGVYAPESLDRLRAAAPNAPLHETVDALDPVRVALPPSIVRSVNEPGDL